MLKPIKQSDIKRDWHLVDAKGQILGRLATAAAGYLTGKSKPYFVRHLDCGDNVVVINAKEIEVTGKKESQKKYYRYSGYPGGQKIQTLGEIRAKNPTRVIYEAVRGMLPQNKLRDRMMTRLYIYVDENHPFANKLQATSSNKK